MKMKRIYTLNATAYEPTTGRAVILTKRPTDHETKAEAIRHGERLRARHDWAGYIITRTNIDEAGRAIPSKRKPYKVPSRLEEAAAIAGRTQTADRKAGGDDTAEIWADFEAMGADLPDEAELMAEIEAHYKAESKD